MASCTWSWAAAAEEPTKGQAGNKRGWGSEAWSQHWGGEEASLSQKVSGDELREIVGVLTRPALKHEDTEAALRSDTSFMLYT